MIGGIFDLGHLYVFFKGEEILDLPNNVLIGSFIDTTHNNKIGMLTSFVNTGLVDIVMTDTKKDEEGIITNIDLIFGKGKSYDLFLSKGKYVVREDILIDFNRIYLLNQNNLKYLFPPQHLLH